MIDDEKLEKMLTTFLPIKKVYETKKWRAFLWNDILYYVSMESRDIPGWQVGDEIEWLDIIIDLKGRKKEEFIYKSKVDKADLKILEHDEIADRAYQRGRIDMLLDIQKNFVFRS